MITLRCLTPATSLGTALRPLLRKGIEAHVLMPLFGIILLAIIWAVVAHMVRLDGASAERAAIDTSRGIGETYYAQMVRNLAGIDQTLKIVRHARQQKGASVTLDDLKEAGLLQSSLVFTIALTDAGGRVMEANRISEIGSMVDTTHLSFHRADDTNAVFTGQVSQSTNANGPTIQFSRRINDQSGRFAGIATVAVDPDYFVSNYDRAVLGHHGALALVGNDGVFRVRRTGEDVRWGGELTWRADGMPTPNAPVLMHNAWDGVERYTYVRQIHGFPLQVIVGLSREEHLAASRARASSYLIGLITFSVGLMIIIVVLSRLVYQLNKSRLRTIEAQATYLAASESSLDAFFVLRSVTDSDGAIRDFVLQDASRRAAALAGMEKEQFVGRRLCETLPQCQTNGVFQHMVHVAQAGGVFRAEWQNDLPGVHATWLEAQVVQGAGGVVAIVRDITQRKKTEILRAEQGRVLELIATDTAVERIYASLVGLVASQMPTVMCSLLLTDNDRSCLLHGASSGTPHEIIDLFDGLHTGEQAPTADGAFLCERRVCKDIRLDPAWVGRRDIALRNGIRSCWSVPILSSSGQTLGMFLIFNRTVHVPHEDELAITSVAAHIAGIALERKHTEDRIRHMAHYDALTGLPNRTLLDDRILSAISHAHRYGRQMTVAFVDLDNFKLVNDTLGHKVGDELLRIVAGRMTECVRATDTVVRLGGDEFVIVLGDQSAEPDDLTATLQRLNQRISQPFVINGNQLQVTYSMGLACYPIDGSDPETLLMNADQAMYKAKDSGRNNYQFYTRDMNSRLLEKVAMQEGLRCALASQQFTLHYQPQVDLASGKVIGAEALIRWSHPERGLVPPVQFINAAEESGLIVPMGAWVLRSACRQNKAWQDAGLAPIVIAVNVSARQFRDAVILNQVADALAESGLDPQWLELELTESMIMQDVMRAIQIMNSLAEMGVHLAIDDFGTGYSSLSALKKFPITRLKIDKEFVRDLPHDHDDVVIATAVISIAHKMNLRVLAEGVENADQMEFLRVNECNEMQGYHFSRPVDASAMRTLLHSHTASEQAA